MTLPRARYVVCNTGAGKYLPVGFPQARGRPIYLYGEGLQRFFNSYIDFCPVSSRNVVLK